MTNGALGDGYDEFLLNYQITIAPKAVIPQSGSKVIQEQLVTRYAGSSSVTIGRIFFRLKIAALNDTNEFWPY